MATCKHTIGSNVTVNRSRYSVDDWAGTAVVVDAFVNSEGSEEVKVVFPSGREVWFMAVRLAS